MGIFKYIYSNILSVQESPSLPVSAGKTPFFDEIAEEKLRM
jgi:hypothetical protein